MGYNKSPFKMATKSPLAKALKGNQGKLPQALQDAIKAAPESPAKQTKKAHTDEMGRKGHFNPMSKSTKGSRRNRAEVDSNYSKDYQNEIVGKYDRKGGYSKKVGYQEEGMRRSHKYDNVIGLRGEAYKARENKFGVEKPEANIKSPAKKYKK